MSRNRGKLQVAILNEPYDPDNTLQAVFEKRRPEEKFFEQEECWDLLAYLVDTLTFAEQQILYHGNITMNNIIVDLDEYASKRYRLCD